MIDLLNRYFVPVYVSNEDYRPDGPAPAEDKKERDRIYHEALKAKLSAGTVHVYILDPDGHCIDSQHVATAAKVEELTVLLERTIASLQPPAGAALVPATTQSCPPMAEPGSLMLHLIARNLERRGNELAIPQVTLGETRSGNWGAYPGEDWICLTAAECKTLFPRTGQPANSAWEIDSAVTKKIFTHFYPSTENNDVATNRIEELSLRAAITAEKDGVARVRLDGRLRMKHPFYHKPDNQTVEATICGYMDIERDGARIRDLRLVTREATYGGRPFGVAVQMVR